MYCHYVLFYLAVAACWGACPGQLALPELFYVLGLLILLVMPTVGELPRDRLVPAPRARYRRRLTVFRFSKLLVTCSSLSQRVLGDRR